MAFTDCLIIGHNEIGIKKNQQIIRLGYGKESANYKETSKFNLSYLKLNNEMLSLAQVYNLFSPNKNNKTDLLIANTLSLTISYLGSYLNRQGFSFDYINSFNTDKEKLINLLQTEKYRTIVITTTFYLNTLPVQEIISLIKKYNEESKIIIGGPFIKNNIIQLKPELLQNFFISMKADYYVYSYEGEKTLVNLLNTVKNNLDIEKVPNLYYFDKNKNEYIYTYLYKEENSLDDNRINWKLFNQDKNEILNFRTSKSCPFNCAFCSFPGASGKFRMSTLSTLEHEFNQIKENCSNTAISFIDDTFNFPANRFKKILRMMIKNKYQFKWYSFLRGQNTDREMIELMKEAGCVQVFLGIESGNQQILDNIDKKANVLKNAEILDMLNEYGITSIASFITGFPGETEESYNDTVQFIETYKPTFFRVRLWWYDRWAPIHKKREYYKLKGTDYEWSHSTMDSATAQYLADKAIISIKNSIHVTDYPIPFEMLIKGNSIKTIKSFLKQFHVSIKQNIKKSENEFTKTDIAEKFKNIFNS